MAKDFDFNKALHDMGENADPKAVVDQYLAWCTKNEYTPKFDEFMRDPNYYKLLEDFTLYDQDGNYVAQHEVRPVFPGADSAFGSMKELIRNGLEEDAIIEGNRDAKLGSIVDEIQKTLPRTEAEISEAEVKQADKDLEAGQKNNTSDEVLKSTRKTTDGRIAAVIDSDILSGIDTTVWDDTTKDKAKAAASDALKQFSGGIAVNGITRKVNRVSRKEYTRSNYTDQISNRSPGIFADKMRAADITDDIIIATTNWNRDGGLTHNRKDNFVDFDHGTVLIVSPTEKYEAEVVVGITKSGEYVFYDIVDMNPAVFDLEQTEPPTNATTTESPGAIQGSSDNGNIPQGENSVNMKSTRMSPETRRAVNNAIADYKAQTDARNKAFKAVYEAERKQIVQEYKRKMQAMEASYSEEIEDIQRAFFSLVRSHEAKTLEAGAKEQMIEELTEALKQEVEPGGNRMLFHLR